MKRYNLVNNVMGWLIFVVAAATYLLTIEPTASFWDCPEFISQGYKLEVGHPPGNPIFILAARFAANFAGGDVQLVSKCVNAMSAVLSAATILLLFWTITHFVKKLVVPAGKEDEMTLAQYLVVMGSGVCGALVYTWSDTFWYSAVEAEVYAFSSFCTALVFWLILKWENRADDPGSDRYLVLIAYVFGVSLGVHLLNLLAIPAIALIFYYRKSERSTLKGSLLTLLVSFVLVGLILYGLEPGFLELSGYFELLCVNGLGLPFNSGVVLYALLLIGVLAWTLWELHKGASETRMKLSFAASIFLSGVLFFADGVWSTLVAVVLLVALLGWLFKRNKAVPRRIFANVALSILMIFIGFSGYALVLIRSAAQLPLDENSPNSPFALVSYLSREQYGKAPLLYGRTYDSKTLYQVEEGGRAKPMVNEGAMQWTREVKTNDSEKDRYTDAKGPAKTPITTPELNMLFPRIHSDGHAQAYASLLGEDKVGEEVDDATMALTEDGQPISFTSYGQEAPSKPTVGDNLEFFFGYQLHYMYWRYFMWNFAGRQNDIQSDGPGDIMRGNWLSGIPFIDNPRIGDQSYLPDDFGKGNKGHNVFYMLPLLLGILGLLWQVFKGQKGVEQFWVVFFLFFMTGIAIVLYLNQTPNQPRERDYAYAGSFYAYAIWVGMGVAALWSILRKALSGSKKTSAAEAEGGSDAAPVPAKGSGAATALAALACAVGVIVPVQMVSQTWDDHDRSGRYCARDFGMNYLASCDENAILFCNGDNDTFPLWYLQEVEGFRTDVRAVNLSYLNTDWYIAQMQRASYNSAPLPMQAGPTTYAYDKRQMAEVKPDSAVVPAIDALKDFYNDKNLSDNSNPTISHNLVAITSNAEKAVEQKVLPKLIADSVQPQFGIDLMRATGGAMGVSQIMTLDLVASSAEQGWKRPVYFAMTVPDQYYMGLKPYMMGTGLCYQVTPALVNHDTEAPILSNTDKMFDVVTKHYRWGGIDKAPAGSLYLDETVTRMVTTVRSSMITLAEDLITEGQNADEKAAAAHDMSVDDFKKDRFAKALTVLNLMEQKLPVKACNYSVQMGLQVARAFRTIGKETDDSKATDKAKALLEAEILRFAQYMRYYNHMRAAGWELNDRLTLYVENQYLPALVMDLREIDENAWNGLKKKLSDADVDKQIIDNLSQYKPLTEEEKEAQMKAYEEQLRAQQAQQQQQKLLKEAEREKRAEGNDQASMPNAASALFGN